MTGPQAFAILWAFFAIMLGGGFAVFARRFADQAEKGPKWLWIQHSHRTNFLGARLGGLFFVAVGCLVGYLALTGGLA
jgi:hypothetical protein